MSPKARESVITSVVLLIIYGFLFAQTMGMPSTPALFPRVCLILLTVLTVIMLYLDVRKYAKDHDAESGVHWKEIAVPLVAFAAIVVYAVLFDLFGSEGQALVADPGHYGWLCAVYLFDVCGLAEGQHHLGREESRCR